MTIDAMLVTVADNVSVHLTIPGEPLSQPRHRVRRLFSSGSGRVLFCDPAATQKREVKASIRSALVGVGVVDFPVVQQRQVKVTADFYVANGRKDIDNLLKFIMDAIKSVVYSDDRWVFQVSARKHSVARDSGHTEIVFDTM